MSPHWANIGEAGALTGMRFMAWTYTRLGRVGFNIVLGPVMLYFLLRRPIARRASLDFLRRVKQQYPDSLEGRPNLWMSFRHFLAFGRSLLDKYIAWTRRPELARRSLDKHRPATMIFLEPFGMRAPRGMVGTLPWASGLGLTPCASCKSMG